MKKSLLLAGGALIAMIGCATEKQDDTVDAELAGAPEDIVVTGASKGARVAASPSMLRQSTFSPPPPRPLPQVERDRFDNGDESPVKVTAEEPVSTFSSDVDTTSYAVARRWLREGRLPPSEAVRVEEFVNYFDYDYRAGSKQDPFAATVWVTPNPWAAERQLIHIGVKGYAPEPKETPNANIVLLLDVSGSMRSKDKLPLLQQAMGLLVDQLGRDDRVSIVTYASGTGVALAPTPGNKKTEIKRALNELNAGGSTAGAAGLQLAYDLAKENFDPDGVNRIILATDGDFNVGVTGDDTLEDFVARERESGIYLSVLGFGAGNLNDTMMQRVAQKGNGIAAYIDSIDEARKVLVREFRSSVFPIAEDLKFQVEFNPAEVSEYRLVGYQTRVLNREDFNNDAVDAGDIGSGHTVTALYDVTRTGTKGQVDPLRYGDSAQTSAASGELAFLKIRFKAPGAEESRLMTRPITKDDVIGRFARAPRDARFAAAVAAFGQKLARSPYVADMSFDEIEAIALKSRGDDPYGDRVGFVNLVRLAAELTPTPEDDGAAAE